MTASNPMSTILGVASSAETLTIVIENSRQLKMKRLAIKFISRFAFLIFDSEMNARVRFSEHFRGLSNHRTISFFRPVLASG